MDKRIEIWNILHDGEITVASEEDYKLTMFVNIPFMRQLLKPLGDSFVLTLGGVRQVEFRGYDGKGPPSPLQEELRYSPVILEIKSESMPITIETTIGHLILDFESISFALDTGQLIDYETIEKAHDEYWTSLASPPEPTT